MSKRFERVAVLTGDHSLPDPTKRIAHYAEEDFALHDAMREAFESVDGYRFEFWTDHARAFERLRTDPPDLVVNFCDTGFGNVPHRELNWPAYLEMLDVPYTGSPPAAMVICTDKAVGRLLAQSFGVPVPREVYLPFDHPPDRLPDVYPALLKPNASDGSVGITKDAVVRDRGEAADYLAWMRAALPGAAVLWQEYLPGPEYGVGMIGNPGLGLAMLPPLEVDFSRLPAGLAPILSYESKAIPDSPYTTEIKYHRAQLAPEIERRLERWSRLLFERVGLRDYGRFDFRVGDDGEPKFMEINPNPAWSNDGKLAFMAGFAGIAYRDMLRLLLDAAVTRLDRAAA